MLLVSITLHRHFADLYDLVDLELLLCLLIPFLAHPSQLALKVLILLLGLSCHWDLAVGRCLAGLDAVNGCSKQTSQIRWVLSVDYTMY